VPKGRRNIRVIKRPNTCFDLGAHAEVLLANDKALVKRYKRFVMMNASLRGPFIPAWSGECWTDAVLRKLNDKVKLCGMTYNCHSSGQAHVQSSLWATDSIGLSYMLKPEGMNECFATMRDAVKAEVRMTTWLRSQGFEVDVIEYAFHSKDGAVRRKKDDITMSLGGKQAPKNYALTDWNIGLDIDPASVDPDPQPYHVGCVGENINNAANTYFGMDLTPWEVMFGKSDKLNETLMYKLVTEWVDGAGYSSYDYCH